MPDLTIFNEIVQVSLPVGLIVIGVWFALTQVWPWFTTREADTRQHRHKLETEQVQATLALADGLEAIAVVMDRVCGEVNNGTTRDFSSLVRKGKDGVG